MVVSKNHHILRETNYKVIRVNVHVIGMGFLIVVGGYCGDTFESDKVSIMPCYFKIGTTG